MTVSSETTKVSYAGNDSTTEFAVSFYFLANADIRAILVDDATGAETTQVETTDYTLTGAGVPAGGTLTMLTAPATGETLIIKRDMAIKQETDYVENDPFPAESHEEALDRLTMINQQQQEEIDRAILAPEGDDGTTDYTLPPAEASKLLRWKPDASALENINVEDIGAVSISDFGKTLIDDADAAEAQATLGLDQNLIAATLTHDMASDADYTLAADENLYGRVIITDITPNLTTGRNIIVADTERAFFVQNDTLQTLTFKTASGTGEDVTAGASSILLCDGTDVLLLNGGYATQAEVDAGVVDDKAVTPATLAGNPVGGLVLIASTTVSTPVATVDFTSIETSKYDDYEVVISSVVPDTDGVDLVAQIYVSGVVQTSGYRDSSSASVNSMALSPVAVGSASGEGADGRAYFYGANDATQKPRTWASLVVTDTTNDPTGPASAVLAARAAQYNTASAFDGLRFKFTSGNIESGTISIYGVRK